MARHAARLAQAFWPGPLTLVLPLRPGHGLSPLGDGGACRRWPSGCPRIRWRSAAEGFRRAGGGPFGQSLGPDQPDQARHVCQGLAGGSRRSWMAGPAGSAWNRPSVGTGRMARRAVVLRPGGIASEAIEAVLGAPVLRGEADGKISAPGQMASHYAPGSRGAAECRRQARGRAAAGFRPGRVRSEPVGTGDLREAAANLFHHLHALDARGATVIAVSPIPQTGLGAAINDRLSRAAAPRD